MTTKRNLPAPCKTLQIAAVLAALAAGPVAAQQPVPLKGVPRGELKVSAEAGPRPTGFGAGATSTSIRLVWICPQGALGYEVYATPQGGAPIKLTQTPIGPQCLGNLPLPQDPRLPALPQPTAGSYRSGYTHLGLAPAAEFVYVVRALYPSGFADSEPLTARTLWPAPTGFVASLVGRSASLQWAPVKRGPSGYFVFRKMEGQSGFQPMTAAPIAATSYNDNTDLPPGQHAYYVQGVNGEPSAAASVLLGARPVTAIELVGARLAPALVTTARRTNFNPAIHGFQFVNNFQNNFAPAVNWVTGGLCGGMSYAVLDYYYAGRPIPNQGYRPANGTPLQMYLYGRQVTSLTTNIEKWLEVGTNPGGARNTEFFNWGLTARLVELRSFIDRGVAVPLGLKGKGSLLDRSDHQVLAIGYDMGRYAGDLGNYKEDLKIHMFDPNYPRETVTLVPDIAANEFYELEHPTNRWRTYFVDSKYAAMVPPNIVNPSYPSDGLVHELLFEFYTGPAFDMRGGADHVDLTITLSDNTSQSYPNISQDGVWLKNYTETARVILSRPVPRAMIRSITISTNAPGGYNSASWDMRSVEVKAVGGGFTQGLVITSWGPYLFTGVLPSLVIKVQ